MLDPGLYTFTSQIPRRPTVHLLAFAEQLLTEFLVDFPRSVFINWLGLWFVHLDD